MGSPFTRMSVRLLLAAVVVGALAASCSSSPESAGPTSPGSSALLPASATELPSFDPQQFQALLGQLRGEPVVVNVWASWCGPCTQEAPHLAQVSEEFDGKAQFLGVDILDTRPLARAFVQTYGWTYPSVFDESGAIRDDMGLVGQPQTVLFDANGKQMKVFSGPVDTEALRTELNALVQP